MDYYSVKDVMEVTGASQTLAYEIIRKLRSTFTKEYPDAITIQGRIPKWYFEKIMKNKKGDEENDGNN